MRAIPSSRLLRYVGILKTEWVFSATPEVLGQVLHTKSYGFIKLPLDIIGSHGFDCESCALESTFVSGSSNTEEISGSELDAYNTILNTSDPSQMLSMIFPFRLVQSLPLKQTRGVARAETIKIRVAARTIAVKESALATSLEGSKSKDILSNAKIGRLHEIGWGVQHARPDDDLPSREARNHRCVNDLGHTRLIPA